MNGKTFKKTGGELWESLIGSMVGKMTVELL